MSMAKDIAFVGKSFTFKQQSVVYCYEVKKMHYQIMKKKVKMTKDYDNVPLCLTRTIGGQNAQVRTAALSADKSMKRYSTVYSSGQTAPNAHDVVRFQVRRMSS